MTVVLAFLAGGVCGLLLGAALAAAGRAEDVAARHHADAPSWRRDR